MLISFRLPVGLLCLALITTVAGCYGQEGPPRQRVSGTVTYRGQPVPIGVIQFAPDGSQGNIGAPGFAEIKDGAFDTDLSGKGVIGGPHILTIEAFSGKDADPDLRPNGTPLVTGYQKKLELETDTESVVDLELSKK